MHIILHVLYRKRVVGKGGLRVCKGEGLRKGNGGCLRVGKGEGEGLSGGGKREVKGGKRGKGVMGKGKG